MMTADQCRAKAEDLLRIADAMASYSVILEYEVMAVQWRWLANQAEWQDRWRENNLEA